MTEDELQAIEARVEAANRLPVVDMVADWMPDKIVRTDVPALVAEVRRLRNQTFDATRVHAIANQNGDRATDDAIGKAAASIACEYAIKQAFREAGVDVK